MRRGESGDALSSSSSSKRRFRVRPLWNPIRLSGRIKFRKKSDQNFEIREDPYAFKATSLEQPSAATSCSGYAYQFHNYCQHTSLHGFRYITESHRNFSERIFWICWCLFGISSAAYMMSKIWQKWQDNPVLTSIATTNLPVSEINFPAITICPVNKAISEKLIIQGCRYNITFNGMKEIISGLVDYESRYNNAVPTASSVEPKVAMKYLRLVSPKCIDYILKCELNGQKPSCSELFKLVLTDSGYCCVFNALDADSKIVVDSNNDSDLIKQEQEFEYLQKAVWQYHDKFREKYGNPEDVNNTKLPTDSLTCSRTYDDDLWPGICRYISQCRADPRSCKLNVTSSSSGSFPSSGRNASTIFRSPGAGRSRGLTVMTDTLRCDDIPTDSFKGIRVYVHGADEFPAVGEKGLIVGPGSETQIGVTAIDAYSSDALMIFKRENRGCVFGKEIKLTYYKQYSRSSCVIECEDYLVWKDCNCVPYYSPAAGNYSICGKKKMLDCVQKTLDAIQQRGARNPTLHKDAGIMEPENKLFHFEDVNLKAAKSCVEVCLPACNETFYSFVVSSATFQNDPNKTKILREAIEAGFENLADINYVSGSISLLRVFFRESTIMQYKRDELFTWEDFISNLGGVMSLTLGFSLLSLIEVIYFFTMRQVIDRYKRNQRINQQVNQVIMPSIYLSKSNPVQKPNFLI